MSTCTPCAWAWTARQAPQRCKSQPWRPWLPALTPGPSLALHSRPKVYQPVKWCQLKEHLSLGFARDATADLSQQSTADSCNLGTKHFSRPAINRSALPYGRCSRPGGSTLSEARGCTLLSMATQCCAFKCKPVALSDSRTQDVPQEKQQEPGIGTLVSCIAYPIARKITRTSKRGSSAEQSLPAASFCRISSCLDWRMRAAPTASISMPSGSSD